MKNNLYHNLAKKYKLTPPDLLLFIIGFQILAHFFFPLIRIIMSPFTYLGIPLIILGLYFNIIWVADIFLKKEKTTTDPYKMPSKLVTYGLFRFTRNPTYLGMALELIGVAILLGSITPFIFPIIFIILTDRLVIPLEERNLEKKFGKKYLDYKARVGRWI